MRLRLLLGHCLGLCWLLASACNRTEEPHSSGDAQVAVAASVAASPVANEKSAPGSARACVMPLPEESPPRAAKALHCPADPDRAGGLARGYVVFKDAPG